MFKKTILSCVLLGTLIGFLIIQINQVMATSNLSNDGYQNEQILLCPTFEEAEKNPQLIDNAGCGCGSDLFSKEDFDTAITFLKRVKYAVRKNDTDYIVNTFTYPFIIESQSNTYIINTPEDFYIQNFNLNKLLPIKPNERLFWNYLGFMYAGIRFYVMNNKIIELKIYTN